MRRVLAVLAAGAVLWLVPAARAAPPPSAGRARAGRRQGALRPDPSDRRIAKKLPELDELVATG